jgi:hypothetical protein
MMSCLKEETSSVAAFLLCPLARQADNLVSLCLKYMFAGVGRLQDQTHTHTHTHTHKVRRHWQTQSARNCEGGYILF